MIHNMKDVRSMYFKTQIATLFDIVYVDSFLSQAQMLVSKKRKHSCMHVVDWNKREVESVDVVRSPRQTGCPTLPVDQGSLATYKAWNVYLIE
jgi:hypothetical protein